MGPIWGRQDPGGPQVGPMNFAIWDDTWHVQSTPQSWHTANTIYDICRKPRSSITFSSVVKVLKIYSQHGNDPVTLYVKLVRFGQYGQMM